MVKANQSVKLTRLRVPLPIYLSLSLFEEEILNCYAHVVLVSKIRNYFNRETLTPKYVVCACVFITHRDLRIELC